MKIKATRGDSIRLLTTVQLIPLVIIHFIKLYVQRGYTYDDYSERNFYEVSTYVCFLLHMAIVFPFLLFWFVKVI